MNYTFNPTKRILMGPGPSDAHPRVLKAMSSPLMGHLDPEFIQMMDDVKRHGAGNIYYKESSHVRCICAWQCGNGNLPGEFIGAR